MKKTLIATAVALSLGFTMTAQAAGTDELKAPATLTTSADGGVVTTGVASPASNKANKSYNSKFNDSLNSNITSGFNDVNSHNIVDIKEDGIVGYAQDLNQAVATSDLEHMIGQPTGTPATPLNAGATGGNLLVDNSTTGTSGLGAQSNLNLQGFENARANVINNGSFNNHGGVLSAAQNVGSLYEVGQSVVVQSNGGI